MSNNIIVLTVARLIAGFGFGGALLNNASLVIAYTHEKQRSIGFGANASGFAAATICSIPIGGMIVNRIGYNAGYWVAFAFAGIALFFTFFFIIKKTEDKDELSKKMFTAKDFFALIKNRNIVLYILLMNIPFQLIYIGLFQYILPLYMNQELQLTNANIGRILSIFTIMSLFATLISRMSDKLKNDKLLLGAGSVIAGIALILFNVFPEGGFILFIFVMVAIGIDNTFVDSIEEVFVSSDKSSQKIGEENVLRIYKTYEKVISVFIPILSGLLIMNAGFSTSMLFIGLFSLFGGLVFMMFAKNYRVS